MARSKQPMTNFTVNCRKVKALVESVAAEEPLDVAAELAGLSMSTAHQLANRQSFCRLVEATRYTWLAEIIYGLAHSMKAAARKTALKGELAALKRELAHRKRSPKKAPRNPK